MVNPEAYNENIERQIEDVQQRIAEREEEANKQQRRLEMAQHSNQDDPGIRGKSDTGPVIADAQLGEVQAVEEEIAALREQLATLQRKQANQGQTAADVVGEPDRTTFELAIGGVAFVKPERDGAAPLVAQLEAGSETVGNIGPGQQMTLLDGPTAYNNRQWWLVRATSGREGWIAEDLIEAAAPA